MKKIMSGLLALLTGCTLETASYEFRDGSGDVIKKTYIGGSIKDCLELVEYKGHEYLVYHTSHGVAMLHFESCKCKSVNR